MPKAGPRWSADEDARLAGLCGCGLLFSRIAASFPGRSVQAVAWRANFLGLVNDYEAGEMTPEVLVPANARHVADLEAAYPDGPPADVVETAAHAPLLRPRRILAAVSCGSPAAMCAELGEDR